MTKSGFAFHFHHDTLGEYCHDYDERVQAIKDTKPKKEQELRLRLFKLIPPDRIPEPLNKAGEAYNKAGEAYNKAEKAYNKAREAYGKAGEAYNKAEDAYNKAEEACQSELVKLHAELCPDCPFDGWTIFPKGGAE